MYGELINSKMYISDLENIFKLDLPIDEIFNSTVLVAGASGLIGSCLVDLLMILKVRVIAVGRSEERAKARFKSYFGRDNFRFIECDVIDKLEVDEKVDYVIHAASPASPEVFSKDPVGTMNANYIGTYNLLCFSKEKNVKRFLYVSSGEVYGNKVTDSFKEEDSGDIDLLRVRSSYPISKRAGETLCISYAKEFNIETVIARPCHIYGPTFTKNDNRILSEFIRLGIEKQDIILKSSGRQIRSNCYVVDAVIGLLYVLILGNSNEAYNISNSNGNASIREIAEIIAKYSGTNVIISNDEDIGRMNAVLDDSKLKNLGWKAIYGIEEGLHRSLDILKCPIKGSD